MRFAPVVKPDPPSLFCVGPCRSWVKTSERPRVIKTGGALAPWLCPKCRPEGQGSGYPGTSEKKTAKPRVSTTAGVYVVTCGDRVKVGYTADLNARLRAYEVMHPEVALLHWYPSDVGYWIEQQIHKRLAPRRIRGEWYTLGAQETAALPAMFEELEVAAPALAAKYCGGRPRKHKNDRSRKRAWAQGRRSEKISLARRGGKD